MIYRILFLFLIISNNSFAQELFDSKCWKSTLKELDTTTVVIAIVNSYDNFLDKDDGRKPIVIYYRDNFFQWKNKVILVDPYKDTWQEVDLGVDIFFQNYLNDSIEKIKNNFFELYHDPRREWGTIGHIELYYRDSSVELINDYYSVSSCINDLIFRYPHIFNMYSYSMNRSFNIKFRKKMKYK